MLDPDFANQAIAAERMINQAISDFQSGSISSLELSERILLSVTSSSGGVTPDTDRTRRTGFPEVIYAEGKTIDSLLEAVSRLLNSLLATQHQEILVTRVNVDQAQAIGDQFAHIRWNSRSRTIRIHASREPEPWDLSLSSGTNDTSGTVIVVTAGTTDANVAEEALETLAWMGVRASWIQDVGVAGPYRILGRLTQLRSAKSVVVIAGMEGALPSVVAGHVGVPIFAVPTSVGYGASFGGVSALLTMLNSCASNVATVNIDGGFRGGFLAGLVALGRPKTK